MATLFLRPQSILLNPSPADSPHNKPLSLPASPSLFPIVLSSSSSSSSNDDHPHPQKQTRSASVPGSRRIRFAPLPVLDPDVEAPFSESDMILQDSPLTSRGSQDSFPVEPSNLTPKPIEGDCTGTEVPPRTYQSLSLPPSPTQTKKPSLFSKSFLKPLFTPWSKSSCFDNNQLRSVTSRESTQSLQPKLNDDQFGGSLARWESSSTVTSYVSDSGHFLSRRPKSATFPSLHPLSRSQPSPSLQRHPSAKPGMRMLNGRIYGRRRPFSQSSTNPFANVSSQEPEFVEWGYGGMGSNKTNDHTGVGGRWKSVQGDGNTSAFGGGRTGTSNEDDASGMAWVKRRREQREKLKREQEAKENQEAPSKNSAESEYTLTHDHTSMTLQNNDPTEDQSKEEETIRRLHLGSIPPSPQSDSFQKPIPQLHDSLPHIYTAVTLPPAPHKNPHPHISKRASSLRRLPSPIIQSPSSENRDGICIGALDTNMESIVLDHNVVEEVGGKLDPVKHTRDGQESNGSTSDEDDSSVSEEDEDSDSDSESEDEEATRKTAVCAGVEKISRHKDNTTPTANINSIPNAELSPQ